MAATHTHTHASLDKTSF